MTSRMIKAQEVFWWKSYTHYSTEIKWYHRSKSMIWACFLPNLCDKIKFLFRRARKREKERKKQQHRKPSGRKTNELLYLTLLASHSCTECYFPEKVTFRINKTNNKNTTSTTDVIRIPPLFVFHWTCALWTFYSPAAATAAATRVLYLFNFRIYSSLFKYI